MSAEGVGASVLRKEDERHLLGRGRFVGDIAMQGLQEVAFLRSPLAHARVRAISKPAGRDVVTWADMAGVLPITTRSTIPGYKVSSYYPMADQKVRFVGDIIAAGIAPSRAAAEDICEEIVADLEELKPIVTSEQGYAEKGSLLHEEWGDNLFLEMKVDLGGIEQVAATAPIKVEREFFTGRQCMHPMEGKGCLAYYDYSANQLVVITAAQAPHTIRVGLAECLGVEQERIRVLTVDVGGGFGYKVQLQVEEVIIAWLALTRKKPFRWIEDRREHLTAGANCREHAYKMTAYANERGRLLGLDARVLVDTGAYSIWPFTAALEAAQAGGNLPGPYDLAAYRCQVLSVATNKPPLAPYRGVARPGVCFAMELMIDAIARAVGREPADVRAENLVQGVAMPYVSITNKHYDTGDYPAAMRAAQKLIDFDAVRARQKTPETDGTLIGVGFGTYTEQSAHGTKVFASWGLPITPGFEQATVRLTADGGLEVQAGIVTIGQGLETTLAQVASEILTIPVSRITVKLGDTAVTPYSTGAYASRGAVMAGGAVSKACEKLGERIKLIAAHLTQSGVEQIRFSGGKVTAGQASVEFSEVGKAWYLRPETLPDSVDTGGLEVTDGYKPQTDNGVFSYATHAAVVAVDPKTGIVKILDYAVFEDCGRQINPMIVAGQTYGGIAQGIGTALFEESTYDSQGQPLASTLIDYILPGPNELPSMKLGHTETLSPFTAHGIKGVGEGGAIAPSSAIVNAINDALEIYGAELNQIPATPERVLDAIAAAKARSGVGQAAA